MPKKHEMGNVSASKSGRCATWLVGALRIGSAAFTGTALVIIGQAWGEALGGRPVEAASWPWAGLAALAAACCAFAEVLLGGWSARQEERRLRARLLDAHFRAAVRPAAPADDSATPAARTAPGPRPWRGRGHRRPVPTGRPSPAQLVTLMTDNAERMSEYRQVYLGATLAALAIPFLTLAYVTSLDPLLGLGIMAACPLVPLAIWGFMRLFRKVSAASRKERGRLAVQYLDALRNLVPIRLLNAGRRTEERLRTQGEANRRAIMRLLAGNQVVIIVLDGAFSLLLICWSVHLIGSRLAAGAITPGQGFSVALLLTLMLEPLVQVAGFFYIGMGGMASQRAIEQQLSHIPTERPVAASGAAPTESAISLRCVHHDYGRGPVLNGLDLEVPYGAKVAIMGPSGAGKSTLLSLLRGTLPAQRGEVVLDGRDLGALEPEQVCRISACVAQSTWLFSGTVADNLRIANPGATDEELWEALRRAHVADEVERMPQGLDSDVGERGQLISGGQAQRLSLARAFLSGRRILLLDEPTSQVDVVSEAAIIDALAGIGPEWTVLMVTHRRSLLAIADAAHELRDGVLLPLETTVAR